MVTLDNSTLLIIMLCLIIGINLTIMELSQRRQDHERKAWGIERKDLITRIQAPSLQDYTNSVVRVAKAEKPQEEVKPIEFVS